MNRTKAKNWPEVLEYAQSIRDGRKIACDELKQAVERFFHDLDNPDYWMDHKAPEFCIGVIEKTLCHQQGERLDGTPLRGKPFLLEPFHKFIIYNLVGFKLAGTELVRFHEALIYIPRKNIKTSFAASLAWALSLLYRRSGSKMYIASAALMQSMESYNFLAYNVRRMGEDAKDGGSVRIIDNHNEHSLSADLGDGSLYIRALAANPDSQDSLNANIAICDEIHAFKQPKQYNLFKEAMKAYTNKLLIGISTAGDNEQAFLGQRLKYCRKVLDGTVTDEQYFIFMCCAPEGVKDGSVDFTDPNIHEMANPAYGVSIRPEEILNDSLQAQNDPQQRKDFFAKSLNVYTNAMAAYFDIEEFRRSDQGYDWTLDQLAKLPIDWYGGADLSKLHDLTAAALFGRYKGTDIIITHAFFPVVAAHFFVFYFGIVADITPPVALAAYAGSAIAKSDPMKTGVNATKLAIAAFIVPYIFAYSPALLFENVSGWWEVTQICISALLGIFGIAAALNGHLYKKVPWYFRLLLVAGGLGMMIPGTLTDVVGLALVALVIVVQYWSAKREKAITA